MTAPAVHGDDRDALREALADVSHALALHSFIGFRIDHRPACICGWYGQGTTRGEYEDHVAHSPAMRAAVRAYADQRAADEIKRLADERVWVTEHDNEVISARDLYEHVARLRGELEPVTYDFPPDDSAAALAARDREA